MTKHCKAVATEQYDDNTDDSNEDDDATEKEVGEITEDEVAHDQLDVNVEINNTITVDKIVDLFINNAFREMHPNEVTTEEECHDDDKDQNISDLQKAVEEKDAKIVEETALASGLQMKIKQMTSEIEALKHDANMRQEVDDDQTKQLEVDKEATDKLKKDLQTKNKENNKLKNDMKAIVEDLDGLREMNGELNKANSDLKIQLSTKDAIVKGLKEALGDEDVVVVDTPSSGVTMNKETSFHKCNACNKDFKKESGLESHVRAKHTEAQCIYCDKMCDNEGKLVEHHKECLHIGEANRKCDKCDKLFTYQGLKRHKHDCHSVRNDYECPECSQICRNPKALKEHQDEDHAMEVVKSREVCYHWRRGNCFKGDSCRFSHVGRQNQNGSSTTSKASKKVPACSNGSACEWLSKGICSYFHPRVGVQKPWVRKNSQQGGRQENRGRQGGPREGSGGQGGRQEDRGPAGRQGGLQARSRGEGGRQEDRRHAARQGGLRARSGGEGGGQEDRRSIIQPDRLPCKFDGRCERIPNCPYIHSMEDFPPLQRRGKPMRRN